MKIRRLVEQAWTADNTQEVIALAILGILGLPTSTPRLGLAQVNAGDIPLRGAGSSPCAVVIAWVWGARTRQPDREEETPAGLPDLSPPNPGA